jgi:hypothetical protein
VVWLSGEVKSVEAFPKKQPATSERVIRVGTGFVDTMRLCMEPG